MMPGYPKVFAVGSERIPDLFKGNVEITEKIDGSMFCFGVIGGEIVMRSKGKELFFGASEKMFVPAVDWVNNNKGVITRIFKSTGESWMWENIYFYGEFLGKPHHNILSYERVPKWNIIVFGIRVGNNWITDYKQLADICFRIGLEPVPLLYYGEINNLDELMKFLDTDSILGKEKVEGIVVKNYAADCFLGGMVFPSFGKFVREEFKERHAKDWGGRFSGKNKIDLFIESFRTEARWHKAIQHLQEQGLLVNEPKDIGGLMKEIECDIISEETENIKNELFKLYKDQIVRKARAGFPEYYKEQLAKRAFDD